MYKFPVERSTPPCGAAPARGKNAVGRLLRRFSRDKSGSYIVMAALVSPILIGAAGLGTEVGYWMHQKQKMQDAADSAAYAAATYYGPNPGTVTTGGGQSFLYSGTSVTSAYGFTPLGVGTSGNSRIVVAEPPTDGPNKGHTGSVEVTITRSYPRMLSS